MSIDQHKSNSHIMAYTHIPYTLKFSGDEYFENCHLEGYFAIGRLIIHSRGYTFAKANYFAKFVKIKVPRKLEHIWYMDWHKNGGLFIDTHNDVWKDTCYKQGPPVLHNMTVAPSGHALLIQWQDIP